MHLVTLHELQKMHCRNILELTRIVPEQDVLLENSHGKCERCGRFDFLVHAKGGKTIGFEVLSRPTQGKLKEKLSYAKEVDEFVFVLPKETMKIYRKTSNKPFRRIAREKTLCSAFASEKIKAWLLDSRHGTIGEKACFCELFNTEGKTVN